MTKEEYLCMSFRYGLFGIIKNAVCEVSSVHKHTIETRPIIHGFTYCDYDKFIPICRPLTDLTKPITQKDYNNGEPFVPIEKLNEIFGYKECRLVVYHPNNAIGWCVDGGYCNTAISFEDMFNPIQKLLEWKFDLADLISKGEAIDVNTLNINPYA